jgi:hypothetical protein
LARLAQNEELGCSSREARSPRKNGAKRNGGDGKNRIMIYGPKNHGTGEFKTAGREALAISMPGSEAG